MYQKCYLKGKCKHTHAYQKVQPKDIDVYACRGRSVVVCMVASCVRTQGVKGGGGGGRERKTKNETKTVVRHNGEKI